MSAAAIAAALGDARREGRGWRCRCPVHGGGSLALADGASGRLLVRCWAGCDSRAVLAELRRLGLLDGGSPAPLAADEIERQRAAEARRRERGIATARDILAETVPDPGMV